MSALLTVENLTVQLPAGGSLRTVLADVSLSIAPGEALGLVGESGSGKSMTARAIDRLLPPGAQASGSIVFRNQNVLDTTPAELRGYRADVAMIFQDPRAHTNPVRRIGDFMTEALRAQGVPSGRARQRSTHMLTPRGLSEGDRRLRRPPHQLSRGVLQRVGKGTALPAEPKLLKLDEPTTALDVTIQG